MPKLRDVDSLRARSVKGLADYVHELLKVRRRLNLFMNGAWESAKRVTSTYRVMLVVWQLGWVDLVFQVPPVCPFALPIQPKPQQPKQTQAGSVLTQLNLLPDHQLHPVFIVDLI